MGTSSSWRDTAFTRLTGAEVPIVLAPLAGGPSTPALVATVSDAGGFGFLGAGYLSAQAITAEVDAVRARTPRPFGLNLFVSEPAKADQAEIDVAWERLAPYRAELGLEDSAPPSSFSEPFADQVEAALDARVAVVSFTFGIPDESVLESFRRCGTLVGLTVTTIDEARAAAIAGCDLLVAQGAEAGGHRGTFLGDARQGLVGTMALVPQCVDAVDAPVLAAGGIMDGRGVAAALALGAAAAQLGTAFLRAPEAGTSAPYREALAGATGATVVTDAISGKAARGLPNRLIADLGEGSGLRYPVMNALTSGLRRAAAAAGRSDLLSLWAGQAVGASRELPAAELLATLVRETDDALLGLCGNPG